MENDNYFQPLTKHDERQWSKLNDLLCNSFNNVKQDIQDINARIENLNTSFANFSIESIRTAFEAQQKLMLEQQKAMNLIQGRLDELERKPIKVDVPKPVFKSKESALSEVRRLIKSEMKVGKGKVEEASVYDIPEGEVRITKTNFKSEKKGKEKLNGEWVEITGYGVDLSGFKLYDKGKKHIFKFPEGFMIYGPVKVFTGKGRSTNTKLFWGRPWAVWNDKGDVATLADKRNKVVSQVASEPAYSFKVMR